MVDFSFDLTSPSNYLSPAKHTRDQCHGPFEGQRFLFIIFEIEGFAWEHNQTLGDGHSHF